MGCPYYNLLRMVGTLPSGMHASSGTARVKLTECDKYILFMMDRRNMVGLSSKQTLASFRNTGTVLDHKYWPGLVH